MKKILTIGTAAIDIIAVIADGDIEKISLANADASYLLLQTGRKMDAESINSYYGGGALNAAVALRKLGLQSDSFVKLGKDDNGAQILRHLQNCDIGTRHIAFSENESTAVSVLVSSHDRDPTILTHRGANTRIRSEEVPWDNLKDYDAVYITNLSNESRLIFAPLIEAAYSAGCKIISNPGIRQIANSGKELLKSLQKINMFVINRAEAVELSAVLLDAERLKAHKNIANDANGKSLNLGGLTILMTEFLESLAELGVGLTVVTDGKHGAHLFTDNRYYFQKSTPVEAIGTVGAGDAFAATLAGCLLMGYNPQEAANYAAANAASVVATIDAQSGLLSLQELQKLP